MAQNGLRIFLKHVLVILIMYKCHFIQSNDIAEITGEISFQSSVFSLLLYLISYLNGDLQFQISAIR